MAGLAWNYIEPIPMDGSNLVSSYIKNAQQGLASAAINYPQVREVPEQIQQPNWNAELLGLAKLSNRYNNVQTNHDSVVPTEGTPQEAARGLASVSRSAAEPFMNTIQQASQTYGVPEDVLLAVAQTESGFRPNATSPTGVKGLMQVTQDTYNRLGFTGDRADPTNSINAGAKLLGQLYNQYGNWDDAFYAYNGGADAVRGVRTGDWGVWTNNPNKQNEINQYARRVNNYRSAWNR